MAKREMILEKRAEMLASQKDPNRLLDRNAGKRLLEEEKLRNEIKKLPKMNEKLRSLAAEWSEQHGNGRPLTYEGLPLVEVLKKQEEDDKAAEAEEKRLREVEKAERDAEKAAAKARAGGAPPPRMSKAVPAGRSAAAGAAPKGMGAFRAAAAVGKMGTAAQKAVSASAAPAAAPAAAAPAAPAVPPPPPGPPPPETPVHAVPSKHVLQELAAAQGNETSAAPTTPSKAVAAAAAAHPVESLPVVN
jgi:hypothetical protein